MTRLIDVIRALDQLSVEATIFAAPPWTADSVAVCAEGGAPDDDRLEYLLEVDLALEVAEVWAHWRGGQTPTVEQLTAAVIHYATYDAFQPAENE